MSSDSEFKRIVRMAGRDLDGTKKVHTALTDFRGIGYNMAIHIIHAMNIDFKERIGSLDEHKLNEIEETVKDITKFRLPN